MCGGDQTQFDAVAPVMDAYAKTMVTNKFDFGFAIDWMKKDLGLVTNEATSLDASVPLTELTARYLNDAHDAGDGSMDATAIIHRYQ